VEGFGEAMPPRDLYFLVLAAGKAGNEHQQRMILGGLAALLISLPGDRVIPVFDKGQITIYTTGE
jgi:hypothetical protein